MIATNSSSEEVPLAHEVVSGSEAGGDLSAFPVVVFAHGILGSRTNWKSFAKSVVDARPRWHALLVDLRNHGQSRGQRPPHTVQSAADDIVALCRRLGARPSVVVGHSWGGKAMLDLALRDARETGGVDVAVVVDSPPGVRTFGEQREQIDRVVDAVAAVPLPVPSRKALVEDLRARGLSEPIAQWMTTNLEPDPSSTSGGLRWKFRLDAVKEMLADFGSRDLWPALVARRARGGPPVVHLVRGGRSDRWSDDELARLRAAVSDGVVVDHVLADAGHWVHTDDPAGLRSILLQVMP